MNERRLQNTHTRTVDETESGRRSEDPMAVNDGVDVDAVVGGHTLLL